MNRRLSILSALLPFCCFLPACEPPPAEPPIRPVRSVQVGDISGFEASSYPGRAKAVQEVDLAFEVPGQLVELAVKDGDRVERGQLLARIDARDYQARLLAAQGAYDTARVNYERAEALVREEALATITRDERRALMDVTKGQLDIARKAVDDTRMFAPFDGTVSLTYVDNFQNVRAKEPVIRLLDLSAVEMVVDIPEGQIGLAPYVKDVTVVFDAFPDRPLTAQIRKIGGEASSTTRTYPITLSMDPPEDFEIKPGMAGRATGNLEVPENLAQQGIEIPLSALFTPADEASQQSYVWVVSGDPATVHRRAVEPLRAHTRGVGVKGLEPGERIVTAGVHSLREGQVVRLLPDRDEARP